MSKFGRNAPPRSPALSVKRNPLEERSRFFLKRSFDLMVSIGLFVLVFVWLWPLIALVIKLDSAGPVFYAQVRYGHKNKRILCYKFRSMVKDSRDRDAKGRYRPTEEKDERLTRAGRFLRKTSLDELPQFLNILRGEMSIIGPRPHPVPMHQEYKDKIPHYLLRHLVRPGLTGWAQVNGLRGPAVDLAHMKRRVEYDVWYIENWSFGLDLRIFFLTLDLLIKGDGKAF